MTTVTSQLNEIIKELKDSGIVDAAAVIRRDGVLMVSSFPKQASGPDVFAMMSATMIGAAKNIAKKSAMSLPSRVIIDTKDGSIIISGAGTKALLVCSIRQSGDLQSIKEVLDAACEKIEQIL
jgi:predicted regulator of Ras-like GTPase activity (Roadblock/LC7/MglB family)